ncbi:MAG: M3 family metallopeptidase, partial [Ignavibacteria bacterium]
MNFKDYKYERPDMGSFGDKFNHLLSEFESSGNAAGQYEVLLRINKLRKDFETMRTLASIRYTINTKDKFYDEEHDFFDEVNPGYTKLRYELYRILTASRFRKELEEKTGSQLFRIAEGMMRTFRPEIIDDMKIENKLVTEYVKLIASAKIMFEGEERNIAGMAPFLESENRALRKNANEIRWKFFEENEREFDRIYDELVKVRNRMAVKLGYKNYVKLGYDLMGRTDYSLEDVAGFRDSVKEFIVPVTLEMNAMRKKRIGLDELFYYDGSFNFRDGNPTPKGSPEWIKEKAQKMYDELSEDTGKFMHFMNDHDLLDLYNRKDKAAGGYCTYIANYESPFIFVTRNPNLNRFRFRQEHRVTGEALTGIPHQNY